jgi:hypothetical protein
MGALLLAVAATVATAAPTARAEEPVAADSAAEARQQYQQGTQAFAQKRYSEAALHFEAAAAFRPTAVALYTAGLAWDNASRPERAADAYSRALDLPGLDAKQTSLAKERVAQLEKTLGTLVVTGPEGWKVQLDTFTEVPVPARLHSGPGVRALSIRAPGKPIERRDVSLDGGKVTTLDLKDEPKPAPKPPAPEVEPPPSSKGPPPPPPARAREETFWTTRRAIGAGVAGVGVAALGAAVVLGINANGAKDAYDKAPTREGFDHASALQTWTNIALVAGGVALAGGVVLIVLPDEGAAEGRLRVSVNPGGAALGGSF